MKKLKNEHLLLKYKTRFLLLAFMMLSGWLQVAAQNKLKIISYNILEGMKNDTTKGKQVFVDWVKSYAPDILALEECNKFTQLSLEEMAAKYGHPYAILVKTTGYPVAITSKYPIVNVQKITDNMTHGFIVCKIKTLNVIVLHLNPHKHIKRREEIQEILGTIAAAPSTKKWMMMGDFNSFSPLDAANYKDGEEVKKFQEAAQKFTYQDNLVDGKYLDFEVQQKILDFGLKDAGKTIEPAAIPKRRIDYIYVSKDLISQVTSAHFIKDDFTAKYSDHKPVVMEINYKN